MPKEPKKVVDLTGILRPYKGKWVAITPDQKKVICYADTVEGVIEGSKKYKDGEPIIYRVPDEHTAHLH